MNKKMIVGVDLDGVVADFNTAYRQRLIDVTGRELIAPFVDGHEPTVWNYATDEFGYTKEEDGATWKSIIADPTFWKFLGCYPYARTFLMRLFFQLSEVYFITTRPGLRVKYQSECWLRMHGFTDPTVLIAANADGKGQIAAGLGLTHFIDDRPENCLAVKRAIPSCDVYLLDHKYNQWARTSLDYAGLVTRIYTLQQFIQAQQGQTAGFHPAGKVAAA